LRACEDEAVMSNEKIPASTLPRLGELFVEAGVLSPKVVSECLVKAQHKQIPVGEVFINSGHVSAPDLQSALQTQELVRSGEVSKQSAARLVRRAYSAKITVKEAQAQEWCDRAFAMPFSNIGKLLYAAEIMTEQALLTATHGTTQQLPLGRYLVGERALSNGLLVNVMNCLILMRSMKITRYQAMQLLRFVHTYKTDDLSLALEHHGLNHLICPNTPRLLDLLTTAQLLSQADAGWCLEIAVETGRQTGQVLLLYGLVDESILESALALQQMIANGALPLSRASEILILCHETQTTLEALLAELNQLNRVVKLLRQANVINEEEISKIAASIPDFEGNCGAILVREGVVSQDMLMDGMRALSQIESEKVTETQAISFIKAKFHLSLATEKKTSSGLDVNTIQPKTRLERTA
jgi:hypothetical protein